MSKKRGLSLEEKRGKMVEFFYEKVIFGLNTYIVTEGFFHTQGAGKTLPQRKKHTLDDRERCAHESRS